MPGRAPIVREPALHKAILASARKGESIRAIALRFGISRTSVNTSLKHSGWALERTNSCALSPTKAVATTTRSARSKRKKSRSMRTPTSVGPRLAEQMTLPAETTADPDPTDRSLDRLLAREGLLNDAAPLFENADNVRDLGALLAIPVLTQQGVFAVAMRVLQSIGPAFYGLRTSVVFLLLMLVLNLSHLQHIMRREPQQMGRVVGLDRAPELKTLRRKVRSLAAQQRSLQLMEAFAARQLAGQDHIWAYLDGHVSTYTGKHKMREHHIARLRAAHPSVMDYWVGQPGGAPLMVVTGAPREGLVKQVRTVRQQPQKLAPDKIITLIFDREGWSPRLFAELKRDPHIRFLTYRKASKNKKLPRLSSRLFKVQEHTSHGQTVRYDLADTRVRIAYGSGRNKRRVLLRQVTRRMADGRQVHILTDDFETPAVELAFRMLHRWSQENYFKYGRQHRGIDALVTQKMDPASDGQRRVRNPERKACSQTIQQLQGKLSEALREYGRQQLDAADPCSESNSAYIDALSLELAQLEAHRNAIPATVAFEDTPAGHGAVQPHIESRRLLHCFRIAADRAELGLLELIRPHFKDWQHKGRSLIRAIVHSPGNIRVSHRRLHIQIAPQVAPYKTRALQALCEQLTAIAAPFPGTDLTMSFSVQPSRRPS